MTLKGKAAVVGIGELAAQRSYPGRSLIGLMAEAAKLAIEDSGLRKEDIDGLLVESGGPAGSPGGFPSLFGEYIGVLPTYASGINMMGATGASMVVHAAAAINAGLCKYVLCCVGEGRDPGAIPARPNRRPGVSGEFEDPYGPQTAATGNYALIARRHSFEYGTTVEQRAHVAVNQRFNALTNPGAVFKGQPLSHEDVVNSRIASDPLHLLEVVMPCAGAEAFIVTTPDRAKALPHKPVYLLGGGQFVDHNFIWHAPRITTSPVKVAAGRAFEMAGLGPKDMDLAEIYDCYTITVIITLEDAGFCKKGEGGPFVASTNTTYKGTFPVNTHGGQLSFGQPGLAGGATQVVEAVRQLMGRAGDRQVPSAEFCYVNG